MHILTLTFAIVDVQRDDKSLSAAAIYQPGDAELIAHLQKGEPPVCVHQLHSVPFSWEQYHTLWAHNQNLVKIPVLYFLQRLADQDNELKKLRQLDDAHNRSAGTQASFGEDKVKGLPIYVTVLDSISLR